MYLLLGLGKANESIKRYLEKRNVNFYIYDDNLLGYDELNDDLLDKVSIVIKSPGIDNEHFLIKYFKNKSIKIITDLEFYFLNRLYNPFTVIITGTNGKSSTVKLIRHLIGEGVVCGNIGDSVCNYLECDQPIIIEVSSYMAEYCFNSKANILGFINIYPNHLRHHHDFDSYLNSKLNLINGDNDQLVYINSINKNLFKGYIVSYYDYLKNYINIDFKYKDNAMLAITIALNYGINLEIILKRLKTFEFLEHRLEEFFKYKDVVFVNDSKSTNIYALNCALDFYKDKNIILIAGGKLKEEDVKLKKYQNIKKIYLYGENKLFLRDKLYKYNTNIHVFDNLDNVISNIDDFYNIDIVLFSPASESFDQFNNFEERGKYFKKIVLNKFQNML